VSSAYHTPPVEAVEQCPQDVVFFRPSSHIEGEHLREEEIRDHWGRGPMETSEYIVNTLKTLVQFTQPFTTRYILGTFEMLLCYLSNMCLQNNISNVSRIIPQMFPTCTQKSHGDQIEKNWAHAEHIYNVPM